jgi:NADPH:quinone reductase
VRSEAWWCGSVRSFLFQPSTLCVALSRWNSCARCAPSKSLNSSDPGFDASLGDLCHRLEASIGFDVVAGEMSARVLRAQPRGSRLLVYGALSLEASQIDPASLIFEGKRVEGFWLTAWLRQRNMLSRLRVTQHVQQMLAGDLKTEIQARLPLKEVARGLEQYASNMTGGKILLLPLTGETE